MLLKRMESCCWFWQCALRRFSALELLRNSLRRWSLRLPRIPRRADRRLGRLLSGRLFVHIPEETVRPACCALVLDKSGSMASDGKMENAKRGLSKPSRCLTAGMWRQ